MTSTAVATLPTNGDSSQWNDSEKALVEAAGLVTGTGDNKRLAPRPVVEAFLMHARRTGLDPIARQIYCIERGGKWGTQVSIDGARLVAERTGQYRGQTPTQWTADGVTWVDVWLAKDNPAAARVGVFREGFEQPLVAVATFDAYNAGSHIWKKMPALMLGKCAEMLALRKAFPQDLSGLYSTEEMDQAGGGVREVVRQVESSSVRGPAGVEAVAVESVIVTPAPSRDWGAELERVTTLEGAAELYREAEAAAELGLVVGSAGDNDDGSAHTVMDLFWARRKELEQVPVALDVSVEKPARRNFLSEARCVDSLEALRAISAEAAAAGAARELLDEIDALAASLPVPVGSGEVWAEPSAEASPSWDDVVGGGPMALEGDL